MLPESSIISKEYTHVSEAALSDLIRAYHDWR